MLINRGIKKGSGKMHAISERVLEAAREDALEVDRLLVLNDDELKRNT